MIAVAISLAGIAVFILLLFLSKRSIVLSPRVMTISLVCLLLVSLLINAGALAHYVVTERFFGGEGQFAGSPDDLHVACASSLRPCFGSQPEHCLFTIESRDGQRLKTVRIDPAETNVAGRFRDLPQIVHWSEDSSEVEFRIPGIRLAIAVKDAGAAPKKQEANRK